MAALSAQLVGHSKILAQFLAMVHREQLEGGYLLAGPQGVGKSRFAMAVTQALLCQQVPPHSPCGICPSCLRVEKGQSESLLNVAPEGQQIKIESVKQIQQFLSLKTPYHHRAILIDEAHRMNVQAANALLKSLEEPPAGVVFFLISSQPDLLLPTIRSRLKRFNLVTLTPAELLRLRPEAPQWALASSRGQVSKLDVLLQPDMKAEKDQSVTVFLNLLQGASTEVEKDQFTAEAGKALQHLEWWSALLRDQVLGQSQLAILPDEFHHLREFGLSHAMWDELYRHLQILRENILGHVDRALVYDSIQQKISELAQVSS